MARPSSRTSSRHNLLVGNLIFAADAVVDPASGEIVCRANLGGANGAPGCVPVNLFGKGSPSQAAIDYVFGTGTSDTEIEQTVFEANMGGELFDAWAGPVLGSFGFEYREEKLDRTGQRAERATRSSSIVNAQPLEGKFDVKEAFAEFALPLFKTGSQFAGSRMRRHASPITTPSATSQRGRRASSTRRSTRCDSADRCRATFARPASVRRSSRTCCSSATSQSVHRASRNSSRRRPRQPGPEGGIRARRRRSVSCTPRGIQRPPSTGITSI